MPLEQPVNTDESHLKRSDPDLMEPVVPPNTIVMPPNQFSEFRRSLKVRSTASKQYRCCAGASSQTISFVRRMRSASDVWAFMSQILSCWMSRGILNHECAVLPPSRRRDAIPDEATARAIPPAERT